MSRIQEDFGVKIRSKTKFVGIEEQEEDKTLLVGQGRESPLRSRKKFDIDSSGESYFEKIRRDRERKRKNVTLFRKPVETMKHFAIISWEWYIRFFRYFLSHSTILSIAAILLILFFAGYNFEGLHSPVSLFCICSQMSIVSSLVSFIALSLYAILKTHVFIYFGGSP